MGVWIDMAPVGVDPCVYPQYDKKQHIDDQNTVGADLCVCPFLGVHTITRVCPFERVNSFVLKGQYHLNNGQTCGIKGQHFANKGQYHSNKGQTCGIKGQTHGSAPTGVYHV